MAVVVGGGEGVSWKERLAEGGRCDGVRSIEVAVGSSSPKLAHLH